MLLNSVQITDLLKNGLVRIFAELGRKVWVRMLVGGGVRPVAGEKQ